MQLGDAVKPVAVRTSIVTALGLFTFVICYFCLFANPNVPMFSWGGDQSGFVIDGSRIVAGEVMYRDFFDFLPPGTPLVYALLIKWFGLRIWIPNLVMCCLATAVVILVTLLAGRLTSGLNAAVPALLCLPMIVGCLDATHHWFSTVVVLAATLVLFNGISGVRLAAAGALCGLAACFTQTTAAAALVGFVAYVVWKSRQDGAPGEGWRKSVVFCGFSAAAFAAGNAYFIYKAGLSHWVFAVIEFPLRYYPAVSVNNPHIFFLQLQGHKSMLGWINLSFVYCALPAAYILFAAATFRKRKSDQAEFQQPIYLVAFVGTAMLLSIAPGPSVYRLESVSPAAMLVLPWLLNQYGRTGTALVKILAGGAIAGSIFGAVHLQMRWRAYFDLPAGRAALVEPVLFEEYSWVLKHTRPGQFLWGMPPLYLPFQLRNPAPVDSADASDYTRPEQVAAVVQALEMRHPPILILSGVMEPLRSEPSSSDHLAPLRIYVRQNYRHTKTFPARHEVWERFDSSGSANGKPPAEDAR